MRLRVLRGKLNGLGVACGSALALLLLSLVRIAGDATSNALGGQVLDEVLQVPLWSSALGHNVAAFVAALLALHAAFAAFCWLLALLSEYAFPARSSRVRWVLLWSVLVSIWIFTANAAWFPHSSLGEPYAEFVRAGWLGIDFFRALTACMIAAVGIVASVGVIRVSRSHRRSAMVGGATLAGIATAAAIIAAAALPAHGTQSRKAHVIIIGIDSLRYDATLQQGSAPNIARFLSESVRFGDATTPLARTFPSWVSILTGRHPHTTGAVINLIPRDMIHTGETLGDLFRRAGYRTVYGIDEVRFSNVDSSYGFDQAITPPIGASEFLLGWFGDTPLSNLLVNSYIGSKLFPHLYANRGVATTYDPDAFIRKLDRAVRFDTPTFFAVHLTLVHWPYSWADSPGPGDRFGTDSGEYSTAVQRVDRQFRDLMTMLDRRGALEHALVIVLSDHGEALGQPDDFLLDGKVEPDIELQQQWGHGTSVLSPHQYHTVLAMRTYGQVRAKLPQGKLIDAPVSLEDVAPTLNSLFGLDARQPFDGRSLLPLLESQPHAEDSFRDRIRFTETEFSPVGLAKGTISASGIASAARFYRVDPHTDRIQFRRERVPGILKTRQYAALGASELLAAMPSSTGSGYDLFAARLDGSPARQLNSVPQSFENPELARLGKALEARFGLTLTQR